MPVLVALEECIRIPTTSGLSGYLDKETTLRVLGGVDSFGLPLNDQSAIEMVSWRPNGLSRTQFVLRPRDDPVKVFIRGRL